MSSFFGRAGTSVIAFGVYAAGNVAYTPPATVIAGQAAGRQINESDESGEPDA